MKKFSVSILMLCGLGFLAACGGTSSPATHFTVVAPAMATAGTAFMIRVTALNASNGIVKNYSGTVQLTSTDAGATQLASSTLVSETSQFQVTLNTAGTQTITATDSVSASIVGTSNSINVIATTASHFSLAAQGVATAGTPFNLMVTAQDAFNNTAVTYSGTVHFTSTDSHAVLPGNSNLINGVGNFNPTLETVGSQTIRASDTLTRSITGTSNAITVSGVASHLSVTAPPTATIGHAFQVNVTALDESNNVAAGYSGIVHLTSSDSRATLSQDTTLGNGMGTFLATLNTAGNETITATDTVAASITGTSSSINATASRFKPAGSMEISRYSHTATLLGDGKVLIAGGTEGPPTATASTDIFDPSSGSFSLHGSMEAPRYLHTATLLNDHTILIAGGITIDGSVLMTAELLDPTTGDSTATVNMTTPRTNHTATLLSDGTVLIAGGVDGAGALSSAELFDPSSGNFTPTGSMATARQEHTATLLPNGNVLVTGGVGTATAELYDPGTGIFTPTASMTVARSSHTATLLKNGQVLVLGGKTADLYDPATGTFTPTGNPTIQRISHTATLLNDGTVLVTGGIDASVSGGEPYCEFPQPEATASVELFDPIRGIFTAIDLMATQRSSHTATLLNDGAVVVTGGIRWTYVEQVTKCFKQTTFVTASAELFQ